MTLESISVTETSLIFSYTVNNYSPYPVYSFNNLARPSESGEMAVEQNLVYSWIADVETLAIAKQLLVAPAGISPEDRVVPFVSTLESRWTMTETLRLILPIELHHPYTAMEQYGQVASVTYFTFTLGYILGEKPLHTEDVLLSGEKKFSRPHYQDAVERQRLKRSRPVQTSIPVTI